MAGRGNSAARSRATERPATPGPAARPAADGEPATTLPQARQTDDAAALQADATLDYGQAPAPASMLMPDAAQPDDDSIADPASQEPARAGDDERRRGWYWHWNSIITQYAPIIGLKGVGLLNSYTVWTDRRDESPHRGYAFPSQQAEADFYGEERAELITINKLLVALDLIEIRKEMLTRVDAAGRKWRVPHNLYRVKDRQDGWRLRVDDVHRVAQLAESDPAVFRHVRRIFSPRFKPIDRDNAWHAILAAVADDPTWQALRRRAVELEQRASARTKAGHSTRAAKERPRPVSLTNGQSQGGLYSDAEHGTVGAPADATTVGDSNTGCPDQATAAVAPGNAGLPTDVAPANNGSRPSGAGSAAAGNTGRTSAVAAGNTTYDQWASTTTTTTTTRANKTPEAAASGVVPASPADDMADDMAMEPATHVTNANGLDAGAAPLPGQLGAGTTDDEDEWHDASKGRETDDDAGGPRDDAGERRDHGRRRRAGKAGLAPLAPPADVGIAARSADVGAGGGVGAGNANAGVGSARSAGEPAGGADGERGLVAPGGWGPLGDPDDLVVSLFEAANDRRSTPLERVLLAELEQLADPPARAAGSTGVEWVAAALREAVASGSRFVAPRRIQEIINRWAGTNAEGPGRGQLARETGRSAPPTGAARPDDAPVEVRLPDGARGSVVWRGVLGDLARALDAAAFERLLAGSAIVGYRQGAVEVRVASDAAAAKLSTDYRALVERQLNARLRRPVCARFVVEAAAEPPSSAPSTGDAATPAPPAGVRVSRADLEVGRQLWRAALSALSAELSAVDVDRLAGVAALGQDADGALLLGAPTRQAERLLAGRCREAVEAALSQLLDQPVTLRALGADAWSVAEDAAPREARQPD